MSGIIRALTQNASGKPDAIAIQGSNQSLTWKTLAEAVESTAFQLQHSKTLGLYLDNSPAWAIADLAALYAGICHVPLPTFFSDEQLRHAIEDAFIDTIITDNPSRLGNLIDVGKFRNITIAGRQLTRIDVTKAREYPGHPGITKITYTSGTTGAPRGVMLPAEHIDSVSSALKNAAAANSDDIALALLPLTTLLENIGSIYVPILAGAQFAIPDPGQIGLNGSSKMNVERLIFTLKQYRPSTLIVPPQILKLLVTLAEKKLLPDSLRFIAVGGAPCAEQLLIHAKQLGLSVYQGYGLSEACSVVSVNTPHDQRIGSVGKPLPHCKVNIAENGEILIRGTLFHGYLNHQPDSTSVLHTGDIGYFDDDGYLYVSGRLKDLIITSYGRNIAPEWVESELQAHPDIAQAAVFGNGAEYLTAVIVPAAIAIGSKPSSRINRAVSETNLKLPDYARIRDIVIAPTPFTAHNGELTANGRVKRETIGNKYLHMEYICTEEKHGTVF